MTRAPLLLAAALACASCGTPLLMKLPPGPGAPAADAAEVFSEATAACRAVRTLTAEVAVSGFAAGRRIRGRILAGVSAPASARLEALAPFGPPVFIIVATGEDATLLLPRDDRVIEHGRPDDVMEAVAGVPLGAGDLHLTLTGCVVPSVRVVGHQIGEWRIVEPAGSGVDDSESYLRRDASGAWRLVAAIHRSAAHPWRAEYGDFHDGLPRSVRIAAEDRKQFDVRLVLSQVEVNVPLGADVFRVRIPPTAVPMTIDELRQSGPFATTSHDR